MILGPAIRPRAELDAAEEAGWLHFIEGGALATVDEHQACAGLARGWWQAYARHFAEGFAFGVTRVTAQEVANATNPFPQFCGAWEAWASGFEQAIEAKG